MSTTWDTKYVTVSDTWARKDTVTSYFTKYTLWTVSLSGLRPAEKMFQHCTWDYQGYIIGIIKGIWPGYSHITVHMKEGKVNSLRTRLDLVWDFLDLVVWWRFPWWSRCGQDFPGWAKKSVKISRDIERGVSFDPGQKLKLRLGVAL